MMMNLTYLGKFNTTNTERPASRQASNKPLLAGVVLIASFLLQASLVGAHSTDLINENIHYAVIIDCGSSGSRANLFQWDSSIKFPHFLEHIQPVLTSVGKPANKKVKPGASSLKGEAEQTDKYLEEISDFVRQSLPASAESRTAVYVLATAGLRLVEEPRKSQIIDQITGHFVKLNYAKVRVQVISGEEEGMFLWLTVNSRLGAFSSRRKTKKTTGVIEMGGASVQVAYELNQDLEQKIRKVLGISEAQLEFPQLKVRPRITKEISTDLNGRQQVERKNYQLFSATFLGLGSNEARKNFVQFIFSEQLRKRDKSIKNKFNEIFNKNNPDDRFVSDKSLTVSDPCLPIGDHEDVTMPRSILDDFKTKSVGYKTNEDKSANFKVKAVGSSSFEACTEMVTKMLKAMKADQMDCEKGKACTLSLLGSDFVPFNEINFIGTGEFYYSTFNMLNADGFVDRNFMNERLKEVCESPLNTLKKKFPNANDNDATRLSQECFKATWVLVLLGDEGFGLAEDHYSMRTVGAIKGAPLEWTLGALVDKALAIEMAIQTRPDKQQYKAKATKAKAKSASPAQVVDKQPKEGSLSKPLEDKSLTKVAEHVEQRASEKADIFLEKPTRKVIVLDEILPADAY